MVAAGNRDACRDGEGYDNARDRTGAGPQQAKGSVVRADELLVVFVCYASISADGLSR